MPRATHIFIDWLLHVRMLGAFDKGIGAGLSFKHQTSNIPTLMGYENAGGPPIM